MQNASSIALQYSGWRLFATLTAVPIIAAFVIGFQQPDIEGLREIVIQSVRYSFVLFCLAFTASSAHRLWPGPRSRWLLSNRRYIGLAFAAAHSVHIAALIVYAVVAPDVYAKHSRILSEVLGVIGYAFLVAMAVTSFTIPRKWLTPARWKMLHTIGGYSVWAVFVYMFTKRFLAHPENPTFSFALTVLLLTVVMRAYAHWSSGEPARMARQAVARSDDRRRD